MPSERDIKQPAITSFFTKSPKKQATKRGIQQSAPKEFQGKEKMTGVTSKQDVRKLLPKKSTRATQISLSPKKPMSQDQGDAPTKVEPGVEKEKLTKKEKAHKQVEVDQPAEASAKSKGMAEGSRPVEKKKAKKIEKKMKLEEEKGKNQVKKRKTELDKQDMTRTRRKLREESPKP